MARIPGLNADVFFGAPEQPDRNWRDFEKPDGSGDDDIDDTAPLTDEERDSLVRMLGFDPLDNRDGREEIERAERIQAPEES